MSATSYENLLFTNYCTMFGNLICIGFRAETKFCLDCKTEFICKLKALWSDQDVDPAWVSGSWYHRP